MKENEWKQQDMYLTVVECNNKKKSLQAMLYVAHAHILKLLGYKLENVHRINDRVASGEKIELGRGAWGNITERGQHQGFGFYVLLIGGCEFWKVVERTANSSVNKTCQNEDSSL